MHRSPPPLSFLSVLTRMGSGQESQSEASWATQTELVLLVLQCARDHLGDLLTCRPRFSRPGRALRREFPTTPGDAHRPQSEQQESVEERGWWEDIVSHYRKEGQSERAGFYRRSLIWVPFRLSTFCQAGRSR